MANAMNTPINQWSQTYYPGLKKFQHKANNDWFVSMSKMLNPGGQIAVPNLGKCFTTDGKTFKEA